MVESQKAPIVQNPSTDFVEIKNGSTEYRQHPIFKRSTHEEKKAQEIAKRITEPINIRTNNFFKH